MYICVRLIEFQFHKVQLKDETDDPHGGRH